MTDRRKVAGVFLLALWTSGCGVLEPRLPEARPGVPTEWPLPASTGESAGVPGTAMPGVAADVGWRNFYVDPRLEALIEQALANNRDLRIAALNVDRARQLYRVRRADRLPTVSAGGALVRQGGGPAGVTELYTADVGVTAFELDLFGRVGSLSSAALQRYFAEEESRRSVQLALIAEVASAYLAIAADEEQLRLARETLRTREEALRVTEKRHELGAVSALDVHQARTQSESARAEVARYAGRVAQARNALVYLVGASLDPALLPQDFAQALSGLDPLPAGLPSEVLLRRPDVLRAERLLRAANADVGAARAAFFPSITLTGSVGYASDELSSLFDGGSTWSFIPQVRVPLFAGGRVLANLGAARVQREAALAAYEQSIQQGFREVADALALTSTLGAQRQALEQLVDAAARAEELARVRYEAGRDSYLTRLESQRTLYAAQQALIATRQAEQSNRITLYKALGGGWREVGP